MSNRADTTRLSPDERLRGAAAILATGVLRLRQRAAVPAEENLEITAKRPPEGLELSGKTRLSVRVGYSRSSGNWNAVAGATSAGPRARERSAAESRLTRTAFGTF